MVGEHMWVKVVYVSTPVRPGEAFCVCCVSKVVAARCEGYNCMLLTVRRRIPNLSSIIINVCPFCSLTSCLKYIFISMNRST